MDNDLDPSRGVALGFALTAALWLLFWLVIA